MAANSGAAKRAGLRARLGGQCCAGNRYHEPSGHILEAPSPLILENFLARIPMVSKLLILSPHGFFGQDHVLGLPDTGGQVVYILDQ